MRNLLSCRPLVLNNLKKINHVTKKKNVLYSISCNKKSYSTVAEHDPTLKVF